MHSHIAAIFLLEPPGIGSAGLGCTGGGEGSQVSRAEGRVVSVTQPLTSPDSSVHNIAIYLLEPTRKVSTAPDFTGGERSQPSRAEGRSQHQTALYTLQPYFFWSQKEQG